MELAGSSETLMISIYQIKQRHFVEDNNLQALSAKVIKRRRKSRCYVWQSLLLFLKIPPSIPKEKVSCPDLRLSFFAWLLSKKIQRIILKHATTAFFRISENSSSQLSYDFLIFDYIVIKTADYSDRPV
jgi:hypothetical protein